MGGCGYTHIYAATAREGDRVASLKPWPTLPQQITSAYSKGGSVDIRTPWRADVELKIRTCRCSSCSQALSSHVSMVTINQMIPE